MKPHCCFYYDKNRRRGALHANDGRAERDSSPSATSRTSSPSISPKRSASRAAAWSRRRGTNGIRPARLGHDGGEDAEELRNPTKEKITVSAIFPTELRRRDGREKTVREKYPCLGKRTLRSVETGGRNVPRQGRCRKDVEPKNFWLRLLFFRPG